MQITTKFNPGDKAWTVDTKKMEIVSFTVGRISVTSDGSKPVANLYPIKSDGKLDYYTNYYDSNCFESREALLEQLNGNTNSEPQS